MNRSYEFKRIDFIPKNKLFGISHGRSFIQSQSRKVRKLPRIPFAGHYMGTRKRKLKSKVEEPEKRLSHMEDTQQSFKIGG